MNGPEVSSELLALALATVSEGSLVTDGNRNTVYANRAFTEITGYETAEIMGTNCRFLQGPETSPVELQRMRDALDQGEVFQGALLNYRKDGTPFWNHLTITPLKDATGEVTHFVSVQRDVTEHMAERDALFHRAAHDQLTGLPNRDALRLHVREELSEAAASGTTVALAMIDLNDFKLINDRRGHLSGDEVLRVFAARMSDLLRRSDYLARVGGDEFVVIVSDLPSTDPLAVFEPIADRLHQAIEAPVVLEDGSRVSIGMSMGVALFPRDGATARELLRAADAALYRVKRDKGGPRWWDSSLTSAAFGARTGETDHAVTDASELVMYMQPIVELSSGRVGHVEALARLRTPSGALKGPDTFLPYYSRDQLVQVFTQGLDQALSWVSRWESSGVVLNVSVNVPPELLDDPASADWVRSALARHGVEAERLSLEVLETQELDLTASDRTVSELVRLGVKMHLDDLSSGFGTLKRLTDIPFDVIKIDRRIFDQAHTRPLQVLTVLAALTKLGADSGYGTVVEGIEDLERLEVSAVLGASAGQGFLFARPMPAEEVGPWLEQFSMPHRDGEVTTALGALAYHWSHSGRDWPDHEQGETCPIDAYLTLSAPSDDAVSAHRALHEKPPADGLARALADATLLAHLVERVQHAKPGGLLG